MIDVGMPMKAPALWQGYNMYGLPGDIVEAAEMCANNHKEYTDWAWHDRPGKSEDVFIFHLLNRDSG